MFSLDDFLRAGGMKQPSDEDIFRDLGRMARRSRSLLSSTRPDGRPAEAAFFSLRGMWTTHTAWEAVMGMALQIRGVPVEFVTCGAALPACGITNVHQADPLPCKACQSYIDRFLEPLRIPVRRLAALVRHDHIDSTLRHIEGLSLEECASFRHEGLPLGEITGITVRWYLCRGALDRDPLTLSAYRDFLKAAVIVADALTRLFDAHHYRVVVMLNGLFFAERIATLLAQARGIRVVTYERGYRPDTLFFSHDGPACSYDIGALWERVKDRALTVQEEHALSGYLGERFAGTPGIGHVVFWPRIEEDEETIRRELALDPRLPVATLFTNVLFDTAAQNRGLAFPGLPEWVFATVRHFEAHPDRQLVIRIHPAEVRDEGRESRDPLGPQLAAAFPVLPPNVRVIPAESDLSSYVLMRLSTVGLVYTSTVGLEMALGERPVIVAGQTHYRGKGFTFDPETPEEYGRMVDEAFTPASGGLSPDRVALARRYAYAFFFRAMIPFTPVVEPHRASPRLGLKDAKELMPGRNRALDRICRGILEGTPFA